MDAKYNKLKALKIKHDGIQATYMSILSLMDNKVGAWGKVWAQSEKASLPEVQQDLEKAKSTQFWQEWAMADVNFGVGARKTYTSDELVKNFALLPQVEQQIDRVNNVCKRFQRMHAADIAT